MKEHLILAIYTVVMDIKNSTFYFWIGHFLVLGGWSALMLIKAVNNVFHKIKEVTK